MLQLQLQAIATLEHGQLHSYSTPATLKPHIVSQLSLYDVAIHASDLFYILQLCCILTLGADQKISENRVDSALFNQHHLKYTISYNYSLINEILLSAARQLLIQLASYKASQLYVTQFAKTRHNDAFLRIQIFASVHSIFLKLCSVAISMV